MAILIATLICLVALCACAQAFVFDPALGVGKCNAINIVKTMPAFDLARYSGVWYETHRIPYFAEVLMSCVSTVVKYDDATKTANFTDIGFRLGKYNVVNETVSQPDVMEPGKLEVRFQFPFSPVGPYWVVDTDYDTYAIVYSCLDLKIFKTDNAWILMRKQGAPDVALISKAFAILKSNGVNTSKLVATKQDNCPPRH